MYSKFILCSVMLLSAQIDLFTRETNEQQKLLKQAAPDLYKVDAAIVVISAESCPPCRRQALELRGPSERYNIVIYKLDDGNQGEKVAKILGITGTPTTLVLKQGEVTKTFIGYTPWAQIKPHAELAKKNEKDQGGFRLGPIKIDWDDGDVNIDLNNR